MEGLRGLLSGIPPGHSWFAANSPLSKEMSFEISADFVLRIDFKGETPAPKEIAKQGSNLVLGEPPFLIVYFTGKPSPNKRRHYSKSVVWFCHITKHSSNCLGLTLT